MTKWLTGVVLVLLLTMVVGVAVADNVAAGEFEPLRLAQARPHTLVVVSAAPLADAGPAGPIIIPDEVIEFSILAGTTFPEGVYAGAVSYKAAQTASGKATFFVDFGVSLSGGDVSGLLGASIKLAEIGDTKTRLGAGLYLPKFQWAERTVVVYTRALAW